MATEPQVEVSAPTSRADRKRRAILDAAVELFLAQGYAGTSMDQVAATAGASKQTVYKHFADKERLFVELVTSTVREASDPVETEVRAAPSTSDVRADLVDLGRRLVDTVLQPRLLQVRRLVIGEANRFPELGATFYELGPARTAQALAARFSSLAAGGRLELDDPDTAAEQFNWLVLGAPLNRAMFLGVDDRPPRLDAHVEAAVDTFLVGRMAQPKRRRR